MSAQTRQVIFIGLAAVLIVAVILMVRPRETPSVATSPVSSAPALAAEKTPNEEAQKRLSELQTNAQENPKDVKALAELADLLFDQQQFAKAADVYSSLLDIEPKNVDARTGLATSFFFQGMTGSAVREYKSAIATDPTNVEPHFYLALVLSHGNPPDLDTALKEWQEVVKLAPGTDLAKKSQSFLDSYQNQQK